MKRNGDFSFFLTIFLLTLPKTGSGLAYRKLRKNGPRLAQEMMSRSPGGVARATTQQPGASKLSSANRCGKRLF